MSVQSSFKKKSGERPQGVARRSQVVTTFGPGSMMDLLDHAVLIGGLDFWNYDKQAGKTVIIEPRLRDAIADRFYAAGQPLSIENAFREPPLGDDAEPTRFRGIQVLEFPSWHVCQNPKCRALIRGNNLDQKRMKYVHSCSGGSTSETVPVRFVAACKEGHLDDFPWLYFIHEANDKPRCPAPTLKLTEGASGDFSEIIVACSCGARRSLAQALARETNPLCLGERPWLGQEGKQTCGERLRLMVRSASNSYFPQVVSALSIPDEAKKLEDAVKSTWDVLKAAEPATLPVFRTIPKVQEALKGFSDEQVMNAVNAVKADKTSPRDPLRTAEYKQITAAPLDKPGELPAPEERFFVRRLQRSTKLPSFVDRIVLAYKLREVRAQIGFTRIEPVSPDLQGEFDLGVESQSLGLTTDWLPATEILGEGVFVQLCEHAVQEWENRPAVIARGKELLAGYDAWAKSVQKPPPFPGPRFYMLHSLAHLLMSALSLEAGYSASSIRERIYCAQRDSDVPMAAILLSTGSSASEGTLGGLVEQGRRIERHLLRAYEMGKLCSNDPVCGHHTPQKDPSERYLEGSACHGCLFVAECSCERFNRYLDRALVVPTMGHSPDAAFLKDFG